MGILILNATVIIVYLEVNPGLLFSVALKCVYLYGLLFCASSHSDNNLAELELSTTKEEDRAVLLEGGLSKSPSVKLSSSSIKTNTIRSICLHTCNLLNISSFKLHQCFLNIFLLFCRFLTMEDTFLLENRATLRAM